MVVLKGPQKLSTKTYINKTKCALFMGFFFRLFVLVGLYALRACVCGLLAFFCLGMSALKCLCARACMHRVRTGGGGDDKWWVVGAGITIPSE